jgi:serine/threonine protein kinase
VALGPGTRLGVYEILSLLGSGGMGEVYRATDTNLRRQVAVKVLPASVAGDPERLARFQREAEILATLNHPNIAQIHGMEEANGTQFLVLELVDGESLNRRLIRGPIPVDEALGIAKQISEALEAAHDKGIIHRDLKPANIALTKEGRVKVLDFGLAKSLPATYGSLDVTNSPTITSPAMMTDVGVILGTAAYMAPEQAKGQDADNRSDIWAFGCVLFEMLTGKRAFGGEDASDTLANILKSGPDWQALPVDVPLAIRTLLKCCVEKDRHHRIDDVSTIQFLLRKYEDLSHTSGAAPRLSRKPYLVASAASALMIAVVALGLWTLRRSSAAFPSAEVTQLSMGLQPADSLLSGPGSNFQGRQSRRRSCGHRTGAAWCSAVRRRGSSNCTCGRLINWRQNRFPERRVRPRRSFRLMARSSAFGLEENSRKFRSPVDRPSRFAAPLRSFAQRGRTTTRFFSMNEARTSTVNNAFGASPPVAGSPGSSPGRTGRGESSAIDYHRCYRAARSCSSR